MTRILNVSEMKKLDIPRRNFKPDVDLSKLVKVSPSGKSANGETLHVAEFVGGEDFARAFRDRQQYEVEAGRQQVEVLYDRLYNVVRDSSLPQFVDVGVFGPGAIAFEEVLEGGEVKFVTVDSSTKSIEIKTYAAGIEYHRNLFIFNQAFRFAPIERGFGMAHTALMNHIHLNPIIAYSYTAANQTAGNTDSSVFLDRVVETLEDAIVASQADTTNPRYGPYKVVASLADAITIDKALAKTIQDGNVKRSMALDMIQEIIPYQGWTGNRGKKAVTYSGPTAGTFYLVSMVAADMDLQSYIKNDMEVLSGDGDLSRLIVEQDLYATDFGVYSNVAGCVEEVTMPAYPS